MLLSNSETFGRPPRTSIPTTPAPVEGQRPTPLGHRPTPAPAEGQRPVSNGHRPTPARRNIEPDFGSLVYNFPVEEKLLFVK